MSSLWHGDPLDDDVSRQYERWVYPEPIGDLTAWLDGNWEWFDPSIAHRLLWPDRDYQPEMDILVAGCGANQAAVLAYTNPTAKVVAIDVSEPSLDHERFLKDKYRLKNLELHRLAIEDVDRLNRDFDLIVSTGVLHHLSDSQRGMDSLGGCLRRDGVIGIMLYARYGRLGVGLLQSVFADLGLVQDDASIAVVKAAHSDLPDRHPIKSYLPLARDLQHDAGIVDTFLHGRDRSFTVTSCIDLVTTAGLVFQDWFVKAPYYPPVGSTSAFFSSVAKLPEQQQWSVLERIYSSNACHFFTACRGDRPTADYRIDFLSAGVLDYVPSFRHRCRVQGTRLFRQGWSVDLDSTQLAFFHQIDGQRTIADVNSAVLDLGEFAHLRLDDVANYSRLLFQSFWQLDVLAMGIHESVGQS